MSQSTNAADPQRATVLRTGTLPYDDVIQLDIDDDPAELAKLRDEVSETDLPPDLQSLVDTYEMTLDDRGGFLWQWLYRVFQSVTLSCVPDEEVETVSEIKTIMAMYNVLLDDLAEKHDDPGTFWELANVAYPDREPDWDRSDIDAGYMEVGREVWGTIESKLEAAPRHAEFREAFDFDLRQAINAMDYSRMQDGLPEMANLTETWEYDSHNIMLYALFDVDLMYSPEFSKADFGPLRELVYTCQQMWRIGNWVVTWEREVAEHDFTAAPIVAAVEEGAITWTLLADLEAGTVEPDAVIERIDRTDIENAFLADWQRRRDELRERSFGVKSFDVDALIDGMESLLRFHLSSRGRR